MNKGEIYKLPHTCWIGEWSTPEDGGFQIFGHYYDEFMVKFDRVHEVAGFRCIALIERVRDKWVVDTWIETGEGSTREKTRLLGHKYLTGLVKGLIPLGEAAD